MIDSDASLVEINPLVVTKAGRWSPPTGSSMWTITHCSATTGLAAYREDSEEDAIEAEAHRRGATYVHLDGDIGIIGNGAGLVMTTLDLVTRAGGRPANFLDIGGGAQADSVREAIEIVLMDPNVKGILVQYLRRDHPRRRGREGHPGGHEEHRHQDPHRGPDGGHQRRGGPRAAGGHEPGSRRPGRSRPLRKSLSSEHGQVQDDESVLVASL